MRIRYAMTFLALVCGIVGWLQAENPATESIAAAKKSEPAKAPERSINSEEPMSIFNEEIRRFKFKIERERVSLAMAKGVMERYFEDENPGVIGAYPDRLTNSLVFIAAPEAEPAIREALARRIINLLGIPDGPPTPLEAQREYLQKLRKEQLAELATLECRRTEFDPEKDLEAVERIQLLLDDANEDLKVIERKIQIVEKYLKIQDETPGG